MKTGFYPRLAFDGIRKNKRMYLPYILTCIGMVMMCYIIIFLQDNEALAMMPGGGTAQTMLEMGGMVVSIFSGIFLFYTNSFLMKRRKKEFGLYNILGMGKNNIGILLFWESLIIAVISLVVGLVFGIAFSKLAELGFVNMLRGQIDFKLWVSGKAVIETLKVFGVIFALLFLNAVRQIRFSSAISLVRSENTGEKPPKANWLLGVLGVILLGAAYAISVSIKNPVAALMVFFLAVVMVIVATYMIMVSGSVLACKILQKKKNYYYKPNHFISVSSMAYRMKRNGAGLASICILATMVLVMISSTAALYFGSEESLNSRWPKDFDLTLYFLSTEAATDEKIGEIEDSIEEILAKNGVEPSNTERYIKAQITGMIVGNTIETDVTKVEEGVSYSDVCQFVFVPLSDFNQAMGATETLAPGEAMIWPYRIQYNQDEISFNGGQSFKIKKQVEEFFGSGTISMDILPTIAIIVPDFKSAIAGLDEMSDESGYRMLSLQGSYNFDVELSKAEQLVLFEELTSGVREADYYGKDLTVLVESREAEKDDFYGIFGGLFYLGIILSAVFVFATVLIIYYKQISEGYEDRARFEIMQKVGITKREIRKSINSQMITVFFMPLIGAGLHLTFAFPIIRKLLLLFNLNNVALFVTTTVISFMIFALFYMIVYRITSNAYYKIVSGAKEA